MIQKSILSLLLITLVGCSINKTRNTVNQSEVILAGGVSEKSTWSDSLVFNRWSWYKEARMSHDLMMAQINADSPFSQWLGNNKSLISRCERFYVALIYTENRNADSSTIKNELESSGFRMISVPNLKKEILAHSQASDWRLNFYKIVGACQERAMKVGMRIPGFERKELF